MEVGTVIWVKGLTLRFRIRKGVKVERGQLLKVQLDDVKYIVKVVDFEPEVLLTPAEIARISKKREEGRDVFLLDEDVRLYDTATCTMIVQVHEDGVPRGPSSVPPLFSKVETLDDYDLQELNLDVGDLKVGYLRVGHKGTDVVVSLRGDKVIPHHILVSGVTGSGKSNFSKVLAYAVMSVEELKYSLVLFDCESEYFIGSSPLGLGLAHLPQAEKRLLYISSLVEEVSRVRMTFEFDGIETVRTIMAHPLEIDVHRLSPLDFIMTGDFSAAQEELLWLARKTFGEEWLLQLLELPSSTLYSRLRKMVHKNTINTTKRKLRYLLGDGYIFKEECETNLISTVLSSVSKGKVILFDIPHASEGEEKLLTATVSRRIFRAYERLRKESPETWNKLPYVLIAIEEAHRYLSKDALSQHGEIRENIFSVISKRGRKYKVGAMYITQMPGDLIEPVVRQTLTKVVLPLPTRPDYMKIIQYSPYLEDSEDEIKTLDRGEALIVSPASGLRFAVPIKVFLFEDLVREELKREVKLKLTRDLRAYPKP